LEQDKDTAQVEDLLRQAETTVTSAIQKLSSQPRTPNPAPSPLPKASLLPGKSQLSTTEVSQTATPLMSKGKTPTPIPPPRTKTSSSSLQPAQTSSISSTSKLPAQPPLTRNPKGTALPSVSTSSAPTLAPQPPPRGNPPVPPPAAVPMAQQNQPHILSTAPEPYNGKGDKAIAFWNVLKNYFAVNAATFNMDEKKIASALTYFRQETQAREWASDYITAALAANPMDYGNWQDFKDAFKEQFIPLQTQIEAIKKVHSTPQGN